MAQFQTVLTNEKTGEQAVVKSNDYITFEERQKKTIQRWKKEFERTSKLQEADKANKIARERISEIESILKATLSVDDRVKWETLQDHREFKKYSPAEKPKWDTFATNVPGRSFFEFIGSIKAKRETAEKSALHAFQSATKEWEKADELNRGAYEKERVRFSEVQAKHNAEIAELKLSYERGEKDAVKKYIDMVLARSKYPESLENMFAETNLIPESKLLIVDMELPAPEKVPSEIEYKYVPSKKEVVTKKMGEKEFSRFYMQTIFRIVLRTIHEIYESDYSVKVELVVFNGWVEGINKKTGQKFKNCIASVQVPREEFQKINLESVDPQECFRHLKGITAGSLVELAPVKPIMKLDTKDKRFINADNVLEGFDGERNLATMDWADFEVMIRDLIQKEFSREGCEVEVTQASRDAGVDAVAFDEDPIRGGKFVIQAKRYNNLVPLTAVRDLFGTVHNEGAVKGILVTTSYYGKDALEFVKNKPLTLINGEELLYMFQKHGYKLKIELQKKQKASSEKSY